MGRWVEARRENPSFRADIARDERAVHLRREFGMADIDAASDVASKDEKGPFDDVELPTDYRPSAEEPFMNERKLAYFRKKLIEWTKRLIKESKETITTLQNESTRELKTEERRVG